MSYECQERVRMASTNKHKRTAYCERCGETCKEHYVDGPGWGWMCTACGYLRNGQVYDIAERDVATYSDGTLVVWLGDEQPATK